MPGIPLLNFYDKVIVPMGEKDRTILEENMQGKTHWLIGLVWNEQEVSGWKVLVYPTCNENPFWRSTPYYQTEAVFSFEIAMKIASIIESLALKDTLTASSISQELAVYSYY